MTIPAFYIDIHEISNNEYRQFVAGVKGQPLTGTCSRRMTSRSTSAPRMDKAGELDRFINKGYVLKWEEPIDMGERRHLRCAL